MSPSGLPLCKTGITSQNFTSESLSRGKSPSRLQLRKTGTSSQNLPSESLSREMTSKSPSCERPQESRPSQSLPLQERLGQHRELR